jgi:hypothetical protein
MGLPLSGADGPPEEDKRFDTFYNPAYGKEYLSYTEIVGLISTLAGELEVDGRTRENKEYLPDTT